MSIKFDVILPTIGRGTLAYAIDSVVGQTYQNWKLHVVQDNILAPELFVAIWPDERINWLPVTRPHGPDSGTIARLTGIYNSRSEWIAYIDDDDIWLSNHLQTIAKLIEDNPDANMIRVAGQSFKMGHKSPRSSSLVRKLGPVNSTDILTVGMAHSRSLYEKTQGWQSCDNHDGLLWREMLTMGGKALQSDAVTFYYKI